MQKYLLPTLIVLITVLGFTWAVVYFENKPLVPSLAYLPIAPVGASITEQNTEKDITPKLLDDGEKDMDTTAENPQIIKNDENTIITSTYEIPSEDIIYTKTQIKFQLPVWLKASEIYKSAHIDLTSTDNLSQYTLYFGLNLDAASGYMPNDLPILVNDKSPTVVEVKQMMDYFCEDWNSASSPPEVQTTCTIANNIATVQEGKHNLIMLKLFPGTRDSVKFSIYNESRELNPFDEQVMKTMIDSFEITGSREHETYG